jgi:bisphosphoglycerate-independent phosphoglycerate mutase (AlkP superfamily)
MQRSRLADPRHRGNHGHLPHFDAEDAFLALLDPRFERVTDRGDILDVAPTILSAVGYAAPASMRGKPMIRPKSAR